MFQIIKIENIFFCFLIELDFNNKIINNYVLSCVLTNPKYKYIDMKMTWRH
jgi:hypothetical protein